MHGPVSLQPAGGRSVAPSWGTVGVVSGTACAMVGAWPALAASPPGPAAALRSWRCTTSNAVLGELGPIRRDGHRDDGEMMAKEMSAVEEGRPQGLLDALGA